MAITLDSATSNSGSGLTVTTSHTCSGTDRILFVGVSTNSGTVSGVTYAGVAMTLIGSQAHTGLGSCTLWYLANPATGANNVVSTLGSADSHVHGIVSFNGASQTGIPDATVKTNGSGTTFSNTLTTIANNCVHIAFCRAFGNVTAGASTTALTASGSNWNMFRRTGDVTPAGSSTINVNNGSSSAWSIVGASFKPSVSGSFIPTIKIL